MHRAICTLHAALVAAVSAIPTTTSAQNDTKQEVLSVGIKTAAPFVMLDSSTQCPTGFSIDLIEAIADKLDPPRRVEYHIHRSMREHLDAVRAGKVDVGIAATSFTSDRVREMDFSLPFYQGGLGIVTQAQGTGVRVRDVATSPGVLVASLSLVLFLLICAHIIWLTERGQNNMFDDRWLVGVGQGIWWTIVTMTTVGYGDFVPKRPVSRVLGIAIIVTGIVLFGVAVGSFSSALTVQTLRTDIRVPGDLRNKPVAVVQDTVGEVALRRRGVEVVCKQNLQAALSAVERGDVVAAVHDVALLRYHVPRDAPGLVLVGPVFDECGYGMTFPLHSELRKDVNVAMLQLMESHPPEYQELLDRWFESP